MKGEGLNRTITFKISDEDDKFLDEVINRIYKINGLKLSKGTLIRRYCTNAILTVNGSRFVHTQYKMSGLLDIKSYDVSGIINRKKETLEKKRRGEYIDNCSKVKKIMKFRISEKDYYDIETKKRNIEKIAGINLSTADFVRFCINAEKDYMNMEDKNKENKKNTA